MKENVLIIGAHPDDETLGIGGTIAKHSTSGDTVHVLIITDGSSSQYPNYKSMIKKKKIEAQNAMKILGVKSIQFGKLPDMKLDSISLIQINKIIQKKINEFKPNLIYTHFWGDLNKDHRLVFESTMVATRPTFSNNIRKIYCYETPSSTEWQLPNSFRFNPNVYVDISDFIETKIKALKCYKSELRKYPHPRSLEAIRIYCKRNGIIIGKEAAERCVLIREII